MHRFNKKELLIIARTTKLHGRTTLKNWWLMTSHIKVHSYFLDFLEESVQNVQSVQERSNQFDLFSPPFKTFKAFKSFKPFKSKFEAHVLTRFALWTLWTVWTFWTPYFERFERFEPSWVLAFKDLSLDLNSLNISILCFYSIIGVHYYFH